VGRKKAVKNGQEHEATVTLARVRNALRRMPRRERRLFLAMRVEEASYAEIARREGVSLPEVEVLLARALFSYWRCIENPWRHWWRLW
jgi:DNA-directed RNA polymerase specialized sigma24 family protein